eukprot:gene5126-biopygen2298
MVFIRGAQLHTFPCSPPWTTVKVAPRCPGIGPQATYPPRQRRQQWHRMPALTPDPSLIVAAPPPQRCGVVEVAPAWERIGGDRSCR